MQAHREREHVEAPACDGAEGNLVAAVVEELNEARRQYVVGEALVRVHVVVGDAMSELPKVVAAPRVDVAGVGDCEHKVGS
jgi:hypothetical protein